MSDRDRRLAWLEQVLGISPRDRAGPAAGASPQSVWNEAKDRVDAQLESLARKLRQYPDEELQDIAEFGLFAVTQGHSVSLARALLEFGAATGAAKPAAARAVRAETASYRAFVQASDEIRLIDDNPFGVAVDVAGTVTAALDDIDRLV